VPEQRRSVLFSQNFLHSGRLVDSLLDRASIGPSDLVLEIGPGRGVITARLAERCAQVVAVEKDPCLARALRQRLTHRRNVSIRVSIYEGDFLDAPLPAPPYKVFANVPFNITAAVVARLTQPATAPEDSYLVLQAEAAQKFLGRPAGTLAAALLWPWFELSVAHRFRRTDFTPPPGVDVLMLRTRKRGPPLVDPADARLFRDFVTHLFTSPRPTVDKTLADLFGQRRARRLAQSAGLPPRSHPSALQPTCYLELFSAFSALGECEKRAVAGAERRLRWSQASLRKEHRTRVRGRFGLGRFPAAGRRPLSGGPLSPNSGGTSTWRSRAVHSCG
jgi:23S rRNA (adenine-N6)-dimethyltransferase